MTFLTGAKNIHMQKICLRFFIKSLVFILCEKKTSKICSVSDIVTFSINLHTKCIFLVMFRPPLPPCTHLYALVLTPTPTPPRCVCN